MILLLWNKCIDNIKYIYIYGGLAIGGGDIEKFRSEV